MLTNTFTQPRFCQHSKQDCDSLYDTLVSLSGACSSTYSLSTIDEPLRPDHTIKNILSRYVI
jgi:hypothetical protein